MRRPPLDLSVYLVADLGVLDRLGRDAVDVVTAAVDAAETDSAVSVVQLRAKERGARDQVTLACALAAALPAGVPLIVNDRVDVALAARARGAGVAGVHLGQNDLDPTDARLLLGPDAVLGLSTSTAAQVRAACAAGVVDYLGLGAFRSTSTKPDAPAPLGLRGLSELVAHSTLPTVAIGGLDAPDASAVRGAGADGIAVVSAVCAAASPAAAAGRLRAAWDGEESR